MSQVPIGTAVMLGTMNWENSSAQVKKEEAIKELELFVQHGGEIVDTARV